jgi:hypothetical protein
VNAGLDKAEKLHTFEEYAQVDERIGELLQQAQAVKRTEGERFCANSVWYGPERLRSKVVKLVGTGRKVGPPELQTSSAYDIVYRKVYDALPDCYHCNCFWLEEESE